MILRDCLLAALMLATTPLHERLSHLPLRGAGAHGSAGLRPQGNDVDRLAALGEAWGMVRYFHPTVAVNPARWDSATAAAAERIISKTSSGGIESDLRWALASLNDPLTTALSPRSGAVPKGPPPVRLLRDSIGLVDLRFLDARTLQPHPGPLTAARALVIDIRGSASSASSAADVFNDLRLNGTLTVQPIELPSERSVVYSGPAVDQPAGSPYSSVFPIKDRELIQPSAMRIRRVMFIVDSASDVPPIAWALHRRGMATVVGVGSVPAPLGRSRLVRIGAAVDVRLRVADYVDENGALAVLRPDTVVRDLTDQAIRVLLANPGGVRPQAALRDTSASPSTASASAPTARAYPGVGERMLAAYRLWNFYRWFTPHRDSAYRAWPSALAEAIPDFVSARDSMEFVLAAARLTVRTRDTHGILRGNVLNSYFGEQSPGVRAQYVEGRPVISQLTNDTAVARSGIALGDVVLSVDGETVDARMKRFSAFLPASSPQAQRNAVATRLLRGPLGAPATLEIQDAEGRIKTVSLPRERGAAAGLRWFRSGPAYRLLADNVGYIDLEKLTIAMVDSAFDALAGARAIVFDARGYPQGTGMAIARRLARVPGTPAARLSRIVRRGPDTATAETYSFVQVVPDPVAERYQGPTAVIVDERTFSQGEHVALLLKAANGTLIVGSPTNGTDGDVATLFVARGTTTAITGHEVMYPDGTPIQGIGLRLDVVVNATIAGVRAGRDELLARAVREVLRVK